MQNLPPSDPENKDNAGNPIPDTDPRFVPPPIRDMDSLRSHFVKSYIPLNAIPAVLHEASLTPVHQAMQLFDRILPWGIIQEGRNLWEARVSVSRLVTTFNGWTISTYA